jgi:hypothetical protein
MRSVRLTSLTMQEDILELECRYQGNYTRKTVPVVVRLGDKGSNIVQESHRLNPSIPVIPLVDAETLEECFTWEGIKGINWQKGTRLAVNHERIVSSLAGYLIVDKRIMLRGLWLPWNTISTLPWLRWGLIEFRLYEHFIVSSLTRPYYGGIFPPIITSTNYPGYKKHIQTEDEDEKKTRERIYHSDRVPWEYYRCLWRTTPFYITSPWRGWTTIIPVHTEFQKGECGQMRKYSRDVKLRDYVDDVNKGRSYTGQEQEIYTMYLRRLSTMRSGEYKKEFHALFWIDTRALKCNPEHWDNPDFLECYG